MTKKKLKKRKRIPNHLRNAKLKPRARKTQREIKAIAMKYPVSSGQQHRKFEVDKPTSILPIPFLQPAKQSTTGGANVKKAHELNTGRQLWTRHDQLISPKPISGGMGMELLQKMGWKPGEGLGRSKTGSLQPILLDIKLNKRGLVSREDNCNQRPPSEQMQRNKNNTSNGQAPLNMENKHPVSLLNELTSKNKWTLPKYTLINDKDSSHSHTFLFSIEINGKTYSPSHASNTKKEAKMMAAKICLQQLGVLSS